MGKPEGADGGPKTSEEEAQYVKIHRKSQEIMVKDETESLLNPLTSQTEDLSTL